MHSIKKTLKVILLVVSIFQSHAVMYGMSDTQSIQSMDADTVIDNERQKLEQATIETEKIKTVATLMINEANAKRAKNEISELEAAKIIGEQNYQIERADERLAAMVKESVDTVEDAESQEESYVGQLLTGAKDWAARRLGYGSTQERKDIARAIITELDKQLELLEKKYQEKIDSAANDEEKSRLIREYAEIKQSFIEEISQQKVITGEEMSVGKKLFWGAVVVAGALIGGALAKQYLGAEIQMPTEIKTAEVKEAPKTPEISQPIALKERTLQESFVPAKEALEKIPAPKFIADISQEPEFGLSVEGQEVVSDAVPKSFGPIKEAAASAGERVLVTEPQREFEELVPGEVTITPEATREAAEFAEQVGKKALEERDITVYGAEPGTKSYFEQLQEVGAGSKPSPSALERKEERETFPQRAAEQQAERREQLKKSKTVEEQQKEAAELGSYLSTGAQSILGSSQYRSLEEEPVALTDAEKEIIEKEREQAMVKAQQAQSALDKGAESIVVEEVEGEPSPQESYRPVPGGVGAVKGAVQKVGETMVEAVGEGNIKAAGEFGTQVAEKQLADTDLGRTQTYEGTTQPGASYGEQTERAFKAGATQPLNPEEGGI